MDLYPTIPNLGNQSKNKANSGKRDVDKFNQEQGQPQLGSAREATRNYNDISQIKAENVNDSVFPVNRKRKNIEAENQRLKQEIELMKSASLNKTNSKSAIKYKPDIGLFDKTEADLATDEYRFSADDNEKKK